ncbi:hypothetical protein F4779DRAFT_614018 [Xylariaceae sp. FL0662B]|nr:hypothetical protein F4779DRAFT_614018 [Xylariaceae sp. FL0662B]
MPGMTSYLDARQPNKGYDNNETARPLLNPSDEFASFPTKRHDAPVADHSPSSSSSGSPRHRESSHHQPDQPRPNRSFQAPPILQPPEKAVYSPDPEAMSGPRTAVYAPADDWIPEAVNVLSVFRFLTAVTGLAAIIYCQDRNANVLVLRHLQALFTLCWFPTLLNLILSIASVRVQVGSRVLLSTETRRRSSHLILAVLDLAFAVAILVMSILALQVEYRGRRGRIVLVAYTVKRWTFVPMWLFK